MKTRHLLAAALLSFVLGLIVHAPAASLYGWIAGGNAELPVRLFGVTGTLVSGAASLLARGDQPLARNVRWRLVPSSLLLGRASFALSSGGPPLLFEGVAGMGLGGAVHLRDTRASGELRALAAIAGLPFVPVNGEIGIDLASLTLVDRWPRHAHGRLQVIGLSWTLGRDPVALGDFEARIEDADDGIVATVSTLKGSIEVDGRARLAVDGAYDLDLRLRATPDAPPMVNNLLRALGPADADGYQRLRRTGTQSPAHATDAPPGTRGDTPGSAVPAPASTPAHHMMPPT
ncbi:type II secretion system protein N [Sinimarinibacterium thermocellulolyticum]|uniref:Type II secretion system protein N n=1 Tax=Sinimarinibacterium thermocellulolyticum TaxID=3170016 RepID=A0ABV2AD00_9GAMM